MSFPSNIPALPRSSVPDSVAARPQVPGCGFTIGPDLTMMPAYASDRIAMRSPSLASPQHGMDQARPAATGAGLAGFLALHPFRLKLLKLAGAQILTLFLFCLLGYGLVLLFCIVLARNAPWQILPLYLAGTIPLAAYVYHCVDDFALYLRWEMEKAGLG